MAVDLRILLILIALTGVQGVTTVSKVSVKVGNSISIPCLYDSQYSYHVKYLCEGYTWNSCSYAIKTNEANSEKFLISDDITQRTFTVTIKDLTYEDAHYWCAVEINGGLDVKKYFHLLFTTDKPSLYVDRQQVRAFEGGDITINCYHRYSGETKWCRLGRSCVTSSGSIDGTRVSIKTKTSSLFTVTMSGLKMKSSGWYLCVKGDLQMPVHLTVDERPTTTTHATTTTTRLTTVSPTPVSLTTGFADEASATVQGGQHRASFDLKSLLILLCLLVFIVMTTLFIWFMLKRQQQSKAAAAAKTAERCSHLPRLCSQRNGRSAEMEITYSTIDHKNKTSRQMTHAESDVDTVYSSVVTGRPKTARKTKYTESDVDTVYSSVVTGRPKTARKVQASDEDVTYSTLASQQHT